MKHTTLTVISSPIVPYNEIILDTDTNLLLEVVCGVGLFIADEEEIQLYLTTNEKQVVFQTVGCIYQNVSYLVQVAHWYAKRYLEFDGAKISFYPEEDIY